MSQLRRLQLESFTVLKTSNLA